MTANFKKFLLTGTALIAATALASPAHAQARYTLGADATWAGAGDMSGADVTHALAGETVDLSTHTLTITNDGTAADNDASKNSFTTGTITGTTGGVKITTGGANALTVNIAALTQSGAGDFIVTNAHNATVAATITGAYTSGGKLEIINTDAAASTVALLVQGDVAVTGTTLIKGGTHADATAALNIQRNATFTGGLTLEDQTGKALLALNGTTAQTVAGDIKGAGANQGEIIIGNAQGAVFTGKIGDGAAVKTITIDSTAASASSATFKNDVNAQSIKLGGNGTGANTIIFDTATTGFTVTGAITGNAGETNTIKILGGKTLTQGATKWETNIAAVNVEDTGTKLVTGANITATNFAIANGAAIDIGATHELSGTVANDGTLNFAGANGKITGNVTGKGNITVTENGAIAGNVAQGTITIAAAKALLVNPADDATVAADGVVLAGAGAALDLNAAAGKSVTLNAPVTAATNGQGILGLGLNDAEAETYNVTGKIGTATHKLDAVNVGGADAAIATANISGDVHATTLSVGTNDVVNLLGTTQTIDANLTGAGNVNIGQAAATPVNANVTLLGTAAVGKMNVAQGSTLNVSKGVTLTNGFDHDGTLNIDTSANAVAFDGGTAIDMDGTVNVRSANPATSGNATMVTAGAFTLDGTLNTALAKNAATTTLQGATIGIGQTANTTLNVGNNLVLAGPVTLGAAGKTVNLNIGSSETFNASGGGLTAVNAAGVVNNTGTLIVGIAQNGTYGFDNGDVITVIDSAANAQHNGVDTDYNAQILSGAVKLQNTALVTLANNGSGAQDLIVKIAHNNAASVLENAPAVGAATAIMAIDDTSYGNGWGNAGVTGTKGAILNPTGRNELRTARNNLLTAPTAQAATDIAESLAPTVDGGHAAGAMNATTGAFKLANDRLASLRTGTGMSSGNRHGYSRAWVQGYGATATQDRRDRIDGYDADTYGVAVGIDTETLSNNGIFGVALSYGQTDVDSANANRTASEVSTYQVSLYGDYDLDRATFMTGMLAYSWHDIDTTRHNVGGIAGLHAQGNFDASQWSAEAQIGRDYRHNGMVLTPSVLAHWTHYSGDSYTENGAGNAGLHVDQDSLNMFELGAQLNAAWSYRTRAGSEVEPSLHAAYRYDFIGDEVSTTNRFIGGGAAFKAQGADPAQHAFNVGGALSLYDTKGWEFSANYDYDFKTDYNAHSAYVRAGVKF